MTGELKACPLCECEIYRVGGAGRPTMHHQHNQCELSGKQFSVSFWNIVTRTIPEEQTPGIPRSSDDGEVERVARALKELGRRRSIGMSDSIWDEFARAAIAAQVTK
jgi:hypothetical protein